MENKPAHKKNGRTISVWLEDDIVLQLDALAAKAGLTRSKLLANILEINLQSLKRADSVGILPLVLLMRDLQEGLKGWVRQIQDEPETIKETWANGGYFAQGQE